MGRIKTRKLKSVSKTLFERHESDFTTEFGKNKEVVTQNLSTSSKKLRNIIAGYATRLKKHGNK